MLPPMNMKNKYTLVLDLDETLLHYDGEEIKIRPFAEDFLK